MFFPLADRKKDSSLELLVHGLHLTKTDLKKMEKLTKINIHLHGESTTRGNLPFFLYFCPDRSSLSSLLDIPLQFKNMMINHLIINFSFSRRKFTALFAAVEFGQVEKARAILEDNEVDINR